jgi:hypothetical protein
MLSLPALSHGRHDRARLGARLPRDARPGQRALLICTYTWPRRRLPSYLYTRVCAAHSIYACYTLRLCASKREGRLKLSLWVEFALLSVVLSLAPLWTVGSRRLSLIPKHASAVDNGITSLDYHGGDVGRNVKIVALWRPEESRQAHVKFVITMWWLRWNWIGWRLCIRTISAEAVAWLNRSLTPPNFKFQI